MLAPISGSMLSRSEELLGSIEGVTYGYLHRALTFRERKHVGEYADSEML
jgi:hypothetical protein